MKIIQGKKLVESMLSIKTAFYILLLINMQNSHGFDTAKGIFNESAEYAKIMGLSVAAAVTYGIINDQVTVRICPEYFTKGFHQTMVAEMPRGLIKQTLLSTKSPTVLGFTWGIIATWWMGALLGLPIIASARIGAWPKLNYKDLIKPTSIGLLGMFTTTFFAGLKGYSDAKNQTPQVLKARFRQAAHDVPEAAMQGWVIDAFAHEAAYASGTILGLVLTFFTLYKRHSLQS